MRIAVAEQGPDDPHRPTVSSSVGAIVVDPHSYTDHRCHDAFSWLRANKPLGITNVPGYDPFWIVTRQADLRALAMRGDVFHNGDKVNVLIDLAQQRRTAEMLDGRTFPTRHINQMDPPDHPKYRAVARILSFEEPGDIEADIRTTAKEFVSRMAELGGRCDFAKEIAFLYPLRVIMKIIGVPPEDEPLMLRLSQEMMSSDHDEDGGKANIGSGAVDGERVAHAVGKFFDYFDALMADRRRSPRADLASVIAHSTIDGAPMPALEARSYLQVVATAGHDTTSATTAGAVQALCEHPAEFAKVKANPSLIKSMVEETFRWVSPSKISMRTAAADIELCDRQFKRGDWIGMAWVSGNRDESMFADPFAYRVDRRPNRHISFGNGPHVCLGQHLARMEVQVFFEELFRRLDHVELAGVPRTLASIFVSGPKCVPIRYRMI